MNTLTRPQLGSVVLGLSSLACAGVLTAVAIGGAAVRPPQSGRQR